MADELHPVQKIDVPQQVPSAVTLRAYDVYKAMYGEQEAMVTGDCRSGFGVGELIGFLYARSFPAEEWSKRFHEAIDKMRL